MPAKKVDLPGTLERSPRKVQRTYAETLDSAHDQYDSEERAHRTAWAAGQARRREARRPLGGQGRVRPVAIARKQD